MKVEVITIGDEILIGQIVDTNSAWLGSILNAQGLKIVQITSISDTSEAIVNAVNSAFDRADLVLMTGGLGPTNDDVTKKTLAEMFQVNLVLNQDVLTHIQNLFSKKGYLMKPIHEQQALVPENCKILFNEFGTAPGMLFEIGNKILVSMPGVPYEMKSIVSNQLIPFLKEKFTFPTILHKTILTQGWGESIIAEKIKPIEDDLPQFIKLAYLPSVGAVRLRLTGVGDEFEINQIHDFSIKIKEVLDEIVFGEDEETLAGNIGKLLVAKSRTISIAESCTGGNIAKLFTENPGSSAYFKGGIVSYANEVKVDVLGASLCTIENFGAVSEETVKEMVLGVKKIMNTDYAIATSGIAGPGGGTIEKPVGTVWVAVSGPNFIVAKKFFFPEARDRFITRVSLTALMMMYKEIKK
jgi:nicotinamide-nucleotide amidase